MAGGSAKKVAAQNTNAIKNLRIGLLVTCLSTLTLRFIIFRRPDDVLQHFLIALPFIPSFAIYNYLAKLGNPVRDGAGALLSPGSDLNQGGITEWCFDILYITWACQVGSALLGEWFNFLYLVIPGFGLYKLWGLASPFLGQPGQTSNGTEAEGPQSRRQQKLQQRAERGDARDGGHHSRVLGRGERDCAPENASHIEAPKVEVVPEAKTSPSLTIEYCNRCRWQHRAAWMQTELLLTFPSSVIASATLIPLEADESSGRFRIWLQRAPQDAAILIWDRKQEGGFPELKVVKQKIRDILQPGKSLGHSDRK